MKTDTHEIDKRQLAQAINAAYGLDLTSLTFLPKGEDAYAYLGCVADATRYFVRAQAAARAGPLERVYGVVHRLHTCYGVCGAASPLPARNGSFTLCHDAYTVSVFPFIPGRTLYDQGASDGDLVQAAAIIAQLHKSSAAHEIPHLPQETFENPFGPPILQALQAIDTHTLHIDTYQGRALRLLAAEQADLRATLARMKRLGTRAQALTTTRVLTHGDPNLDNLLKDDQGRLYLTDWGDLAVGPPERDLFAFTGERFEAFLRPYLRAHARVQLNPEFFAFYFYRWALQEIADYSTRLLFHSLGAEEEEHAWQELQPYLPVPHQAIAQGVQAVQTLLARM